MLIQDYGPRLSPRVGPTHTDAVLDKSIACGRLTALGGLAWLASAG
jgi:hypothetical protein